MFKRISCVLAAALVAATAFAGPARAAGDPDRMPVPYDLGGGFVLYSDNGHISCRRATFDESQLIKLRDPGETLHVINPWKLDKAQRGTPADGLTILLRGTTQLDSFPQAKNAYIRAAETWEALIRTPITIVIDVDFGPKRFGQSYPPGVLGSTNSQFPDFAINWSSMRARLISRASNQAEADLYNQMPSSAGVPTTEGNCTLVYLPTAVLRALGYIDAVADPDAEQDDLGDPPSIGFNSAFAYDFDPTDGVDSNKQDFNATALHEIGHALGFDSWAGLKELAPSNPILVTTWDLFRFRPGVTLSQFGSTQRVTNSGGEQIQYSGGANTRLSTGRPNATGGDQNQASHWKDNVLNNNTYIGIMDPTGADGDKDQLTAIDLATLDLIGYDVRGLVSGDGVDGVLTGNTLTINGTATVANLVLSKARVTLLDASGATLSTLPDVTVNAVGSSLVTLQIPVTGLGDFPTATMADVTLFDDKNNSSTVRVDFGKADEGGPAVASLNYNGKKFKITGSGFTGTVQIEVNGVVVPANIKIKKNGTKLNIKGSASTFGLTSGANRVRILANGLRSNITIVNR